MSIIRNSFQIYKKSILLIIVFALICLIIPSVSSAEIVPELLGAGFEGPFGIVYDASGNLLVTNENDIGTDGSSYISSIAPDGTISIFSSGFTGVSGLAYDSNGTLFASDDTDQIYQIDSIGDWTVVVPGGVGLLNPNAIAFDASDNLYVLNAGGFVSKFDSSGGLIDIALAGGFNVPQGIVVDDADGLLYVADAGGRIYQVDMYNGETNLWLETGYDSNGGFTMDSQRNFFLSSPGSGSVIRIDRNDMSVSVCVTGYDHPRGLLFDGLGRLIFTEYNPGNVFRIDECDEFIQPFNANFTASITSNWIDMREFTPDALVVIEIYSEVDGNLLFGETRPTDGNGGVWLDGGEHNIDLVPGMYIVITDEDVLLTKDLVLEPIFLDVFDVENDLMEGNAPAEVWLWVDAGNEFDGYGLEVLSDNAGFWLADFGFEGFDITDDMGGAVHLYDEDGDDTVAEYWTPQPPSMTVQPDHGWINTRGWENNVLLTIYIDDNDDLGDDYLWEGDFVTEEMDGDPNNVGVHAELWPFIDLSPGQYVTISSDTQNVQYQIEDITYDYLDEENDVSGGNGPAGKNGGAWIDSDSGGHWMEVEFLGDGSWVADFGAEGFDIVSPLYDVFVEVYDGLGNATMAHWDIVQPPTFAASLTSNWVDMFNFSPDASVTIDIYESDGGSLLFSEPIGTNEDGQAWLDGGEHGIDLVPGIFIVVTDDVTLLAKELEIQPLSLDVFDIDNDIIEGTAPAESWVWVDAGNQFDGFGMEIQADIFGFWSVDFGSEGFDITGDMGGSVHLSDEDGDETIAEPVRPPDLHVVPAFPSPVNSYKEIHGHGWSEYSIITMSIDDDDNLGNGMLYSETKAANDDPWCSLPCFDMEGIHAVEVGHVVTMSDDQFTRIVHVTYITIEEVDIDAETVRGMTDPYAEVWVDIHDESGGANRHVVADENGDWLADFSVPGDEPEEWMVFDILLETTGRAIRFENPGFSDDGTMAYWEGSGSGPVINPTTEVVVPPGEFIQLSVVVDLSGPVFQSGIIGPMDATAVQMAIEDFGLIHGFAILQITFDGECSQVGGNTVASIIATDANNVGVIGHNCSNSTIEGLPLYEEAGMVLISGSATNGALPDVGSSVFNRTILQDGDFWDVDPTSLASYINWEVEYSSRFGNNPGPFSAYFYDAASLLLTRLFETAILDQSGNLVINRAVLAGAVRNTDGYLGVTGCIVIDEVGNRVAYDSSENCNLFPIANASGPYEGDEGSPIYLDGSASYDPDGGSLTYQWDLDNDGTFETSGMNVEVTFDDNDTFLVGLLVTDDLGGTDTTVAEIVVNNVSPDVGEIAAPVYPVQINTEILVSASFFDPGADSWTAIWDWGDNSTSEGTINEFVVDGNHAYDAPGVYTLTLTVVDDDGGVGVSVYQYLVIYEPNGGFVTGGGWIWSPQGAYAGDTSLEGNARFGFVAKYKKGANTPTGITQFQFKVGDLNFHSTEYDWLVVAGARAQFKGVGTINGEGEYGFMLTVFDGELNGGGGVDKFRIKIWSIETGEIVYDNQMGELEDVAPAIEIVSGSIVVHKK